MLREKMKGWSVGFPTLLQPMKPGKDNRVKLKKHEGSSQRDPVYQNTARTVLHPKQITKHTIIQNTQSYSNILYEEEKERAGVREY